ncbi:hypothetical protein SEA_SMOKINGBUNNY_61 [Gordonia phage SmokingBunny]|uniref:Helix-turn-helix DNA binding domain protein n=1 Tax=Gordonia phage SmokingBunny TaxID=2572528 RepID=A0A4D6TEK0_9CAUD|nr:replication initiation protein [Gordonia phage SmokingBunny]QCG77872.1 hypothetical protein SEA_SMOKINGBUNNY_61 [Gordonia phage SmokingBunny]WAA20278.1 hypothetical protein SEA_TOGO_60 [Gordonia phage Togo]
MTTGRQYAKVWFRLMRDRDFTTMPQFDKMLYLAILASDSLNAAGVTPLYYRRWALACADDGTIPTDRDVKAGLTRLEANAYVYTDEYTGELLVRTFIRGDQVDKQPNVLKSALRAITAIQSDKLSAVLLGEFDRGITIPQIKAKTAESTRRMQDQMDAMATEAIEHLKATAEGITEPYPQPFPEEFPEGLSEPFAKALTEGFQRPGKTEPFPEPFPEGMPKPPVEVVVGVEVETSPTEVVTGGNTREREATPPEPAQPSNEPPTPQPERRQRPPRSLPAGPDGEPPQRCPRHLGVPDGEVPDCGPCAELRKAHDRWTARRTHARAEATASANRTRADLTRAEIDACDLCDDHGYELTNGDGPSGVCRHNPDQAATNARGRAKLEQLRAQMAAGKSTPKPDPEPDPEPEP